jgi:hypothetical protein
VNLLLALVAVLPAIWLAQELAEHRTDTQPRRLAIEARRKPAATPRPPRVETQRDPGTTPTGPRVKLDWALAPVAMWAGVWVVITTWGWTRG